MKKSTNFIGVAIMTSALFVSCNQQNKALEQKDTTSKDSVVSTTTIVPVLKDQHSSEVYTHYIHLKDALVASDATEAQKASKDLADELKDIKGCEVTSVVADKIANSTDLKVQRAAFTPLSSDIIALMKTTDIESGKMYVNFCPMANDGKGGYWLSSNNEIKNPYYGKSMLKCGEVKEVFEKKL